MRPAELFREALPPREERAEARIVDGLRYVRARPDLLLPIVLMLIVGMFGFNFQVTLSLLTKTVFHAGAASFGLFSTALAVGALCGALAGSGRRTRPSVYMVIGSGVAFCVAETLTGFAPTFWTMAGLLALTGFLMMFYSQSSNQRVQLGVDAAYRGRVMALYMLVFLGTNPVGAIVNGWCAQVLGPRACLYLGGLVSLVATLGALGYQLRRTGARVRLRMLPMPRFYVVQPVEINRRQPVVGLWLADPHGRSGASGRGRGPATRGGRARPVDAGAELPGVDGDRPGSARRGGLSAQGRVHAAQRPPGTVVAGSQRRAAAGPVRPGV
jgi:MFS family permease